MSEAMTMQLATPPNVPTLGQIQEFEALMREQPNQVVIATAHHFPEGIYAREIFIPSGVMLTGKLHKTRHLNIVSQGELTVWTEEGMKRIKAPFTFISESGTKRIGLAHADTVWTTIHPNPQNTRDLELLESILIVPENNLTGGESCPLLQ